VCDGEQRSFRHQKKFAKNRSNSHGRVHKTEQRNVRIDSVCPNQIEYTKVEFRKTRGEGVFGDGKFRKDPLKHIDSSDWDFCNKDDHIYIATNKDHAPQMITKMTSFATLREKDPQFLHRLEKSSMFISEQFRKSNGIKTNSAHKRAGGGGQCMMFGYRKGYDKGWDLGRYVPTQSVQNNEDKMSQWAEEQEQLSDVEGLYRSRFQLLSPLLFKKTAEQAEALEVPSFSQLNFHEEHENTFASSLFVSKNYVSAEHNDDDAQEWVFGIFFAKFATTGK